MSNRDECPGCKSVTTNIACPICSCPDEMLVEWNQMKNILEVLRSKKISEELLKKLDDMTNENDNLETKILKMYELLTQNKLIGLLKGE